MNNSEYFSYDALGLAELVRTKQISSIELLEVAIALTEKLDPKLNAVPIKHFELARENLKNNTDSGIFNGVPFLLKDLNNYLKGTVTSGGSRVLENIPADHTSELVKRTLNSGLNIFGKTNSPELGLTVTTEPVLYGPTRNPWNLDRSSGGSSGGASSAVAAGIIPMAQASDGGGSIRIPASCCGLFGLKPTRARTPLGPVSLEGWGGQSIFHCVSVSVRDSAALLDVTSGHEKGAPYRSAYQEKSFLEQINIEPGNLKIGYLEDSSISVDEDVKEVMNSTIDLCQKLGHSVESTKINFSSEEISLAIITIISSNVSYAVKSQSDQTGREVSNEYFENVTLQMAENGNNFSASDYVNAIKINHRLGQELEKMFDQYDVLLSPVLASPPIKIGTIDMNTKDMKTYVERLTKYSPFTGIFNQSGQPSMSVPLFRTKDNLPVGSMFSAAFGNENLLFSLAGQLEQAQPWVKSLNVMREKLLETI
ncbi:MAG: amidase [Gammaproteobacteria bacterium]|tara:strand:- start:4829 stop:6271 length:1443 start_codon:yes stop_codon:yes gene_type:complete